MDRLSLTIAAGEIVGIAGVSGNGQRELVEALIGQRPRAGGEILVGGEPFHATRDEIRRHRVFSLTEEPLRNACVPGMTVAENMTFRNFDRPPQSSGPWLRRGALRAQAERWIHAFSVKTEGPDATMATLSGGNVQRAVLARELSESVSVLIAANPVFGLDLRRSPRSRPILAARNAGAAVLLVSEDLDELLELSDRIAVIFDDASSTRPPPRRPTSRSSVRAWPDTTQRRRRSHRPCLRSRRGRTRTHSSRRPRRSL